MPQASDQIPHILFVDDDASILDGLRRLLSRHRKEWHMHFAAGGAEALDLLARETIDVAVLDVNMPGLDGLEVLKRIKEDSGLKDMEVIMLTGMEDTTLKHRSVTLGATDLLVKPIEKESLEARLQSALRLRRYHQMLLRRNQELEEQLIEAQKIAIVGKLVHGLAHDLNNIHTTISGYAQLLQMDLGDRERMHEHLKMILAADQRARGLIAQVLRFTRPVEKNRNRLDLVEVVNEILGFSRVCLKRGQQFEWAPPERPCYVHANKIQMHQAMLNMLLKTIEDASSNSVLQVILEEADYPNAKIPCEDLREDRYVSLCVEAQEFEARPQGITMHGAGTGLSLLIATCIAEEHGGFLCQPDGSSRSALFIPAIA